MKLYVLVSLYPAGLKLRNNKFLDFYYFYGVDDRCRRKIMDREITNPVFLDRLKISRIYKEFKKYTPQV